MHCEDPDFLPSAELLSRPPKFHQLTCLHCTVKTNKQTKMPLGACFRGQDFSLTYVSGTAYIAFWCPHVQIYHLDFAVQRASTY